MTQFTSVDAVQLHSGCVVTDTFPGPPLASIELEDVRSETGHLTGDGPVATLVEDPHARVAHETRIAAAANRRFVRESTANVIELHVLGGGQYGTTGQVMKMCAIGYAIGRRTPTIRSPLAALNALAASRCRCFARAIATSNASCPRSLSSQVSV